MYNSIMIVLLYLNIFLNVVGVLGLDEEGLFRLAAGSSKVRRLRAEIEAGQVSRLNIY